MSDGVHGPDSRLPEVHLPAAGLVVFHGSNTPGLAHLAPGENVTLGNGAYFTSSRSAASEYAVRRTKYRGGSACLYRTTLGPDVCLVDLRDVTSITALLHELAPPITSWATQPSPGNPFVQQIATRALASMRDQPKRALHMIGERFAPLLTHHLTSQGYDGLVANERGEARVRAHDSWVLYAPERLPVQSVPMARLALRGPSTLGR